MTLHPAVARRLEATADHATSGTCPACGAEVLRARAGRAAALDVTADVEALDLDAEIRARMDGRLTWRLITTALGVRRIAWRDPLTIPHNRAGHVIADHRCPAQPIQEVLA